MVISGSLPMPPVTHPTQFTPALPAPIGLQTTLSPRMRYTHAGSTPRTGKASAHTPVKSCLSWPPTTSSTKPKTGRDKAYGRSASFDPAIASSHLSRPTYARNQAFSSVYVTLPRHHGLPTDCRPPSSPKKTAAPLSANSKPFLKKETAGRVRYCDQNRYRDIALLTCAKDELNKYVNKNRKYLGDTRTRTIAELGAKIDAHMRNIMHTDPRLKETDVFRREALNLNELVNHQLNAKIDKARRTESKPKISPKTVQFSPQQTITWKKTNDSLQAIQEVEDREESDSGDESCDSVLSMNEDPVLSDFIHEMRHGLNENASLPNWALRSTGTMTIGAIGVKRRTGAGSPTFHTVFPLSENVNPVSSGLSGNAVDSSGNKRRT